jgi:hypothetical protein
LQIKTKIVSCHTGDTKPVKQEVSGTVILPPLVFPASSIIRLIAVCLDDQIPNRDFLALYSLSTVSSVSGIASIFPIVYHENNTDTKTPNLGQNDVII